MPPRTPTQREVRPAAPARPPREPADNWLYGRHAVAGALANPRRRWRRLAITAGHETAAEALIAAARARRRGARGEPAGEPVQVLDRAAFDLMLPGGAVHQGWALAVEPLDPPDLDDVLRAPKLGSARSIILVLDQVTDPHNVGAVLRSAAAFGATAVVVAAHGAPPLTGVLAKAASGALDCVPLVRVVNLARALDRLKEAGYWCCGLDESAPAPLAGLDLGTRVALVLGSEGGGLRRLLRERCDYLARLPTRPELPSLNVSNAAAIALYELVRAESAG
ncbi:MAG TPA: 23S rRNA (guanosine(2251)-2'-O)-methyltransferase RlmB [Stellaceae bacterium]|nr:23S rRNA (guanosine(2251)-2'-O)-methyltransferase RlmB [Stellaceae bacterium]